MAGLRIAFYDNEKDNLPKSVEFSSWDEFAQELLSHEMTACSPCPGKSCEAKRSMCWSPVIIDGDAKRSSGNVKGVTLAAFDLDHLTAAQLEALAGRLEGLECVLHSTHNHHPPDDLCLRLVFPVSRIIWPKEWPLVREALVRQYQIPADQSTKDLSRIYYLPTAPSGSTILAVRGEGATLDVAEILSSAHLFNAKRVNHVAPGEVEQPLAAGEPGTVNVSKLREMLRNYNPQDNDEKREIIRRVRNGEPLAEEGARDNTVHRAASILACLFPSDTPKEVVMEILRPSIVSMPGPEGGEHWLEKASFSYDRAFEGRIERDAKRKASEEETLRRIHKLTKKRYQKTETIAESTPDADGEEDEEDPEWWKALLRYKTTREGTFFESTGANAAVILEHSPEWRGVLRFNEITKNVEVSGGPLQATERASSQLHVAINNWLHRSEWDLRVANHEISAQMLHVARRHSYNPVADYLSGLKWDGEKRADFFLERYCGAGLHDPRTGDITEYLRKAGSKWLISAAARALRPGCKVDTVLVLEGPQGTQKSTLFKILAGEWFADSQLRLEDKDSKLLAAQSWIIELAELVSLRKSDAEAYKSFLTSCIDKFRPPYGSAVEDFPRRCVFVGTTNDARYLIDLTGNRRFWPVLCGEFDLKSLAADKDQLWAEAVARLQAGEAFWFLPEEQELADRQTAGRMKTPAKVEAIWSWWTRLPKDKRPVQLLSSEVSEQALNILPSHQDERTMEGIDRAMQYLGFNHEQRNDTEHSSWIWTPTERLRSVERGTGRDYLRMIAAAPVKHDETVN